LAENNILKIIDFGLSHEFEGDELLKTKCGSPSYAAPEIICCPFYDGFKVDIWCCGIILYAMLCGYLPFEGEDNNVLFQNILNCNPEFPSFLSELSKDIILRILTPDPDYRISIDNIKRHAFYLKGKKLCNIDYDSIENNIIKKRSKFSKKKVKNKTDLNLNDNNNLIKNDKYFLTNNNNYFYNHNEDKNKKKINLISLEQTKKSGKNKKNNNSTKHLKNASLEKPLKKKMTDINYKYAQKIDTMINTIQKSLKTEINEKIKESLKPFSSHKNIRTINFKANTNMNMNLNGNNNIAKTPYNTNLNTFYNNKKENNPAFIDLISDNKNKKNFIRNDLFIKLLDSKNNKNNKFFHLYNDKLGFIKYDTNRINSDKNKSDEPNQKNINKNMKNKDNGTLFNNFKTHLSKHNNDLNDINNLDNILSLSNDIFTDIEKYQKTCNNKKNQRINIFKDTIKTEKIKGKPYSFSIKNALSKNEDKNRNNQNVKSFKDNEKKSSRNNSSKVNKTKHLNLYIPNSTLYYNNININIKEVNINPKLSKKTGTIISSLIGSPKIKTPTQTKKNINYPYSESRKIIKNRAFSAKRLYSYNINTNNIDNFKSTFNKMDNNNNLYTISNNNINRHFFINTITTNENNNRKMRKYKNKECRLSKDIKFVYSDKNFNLFKNVKILTTEPKELLNKQFSYSKAFSYKNKDEDKININNNITNRYIKNKHKRSNTERTLKCKTINTESGKMRFKNRSNLKLKKYRNMNEMNPNLHTKNQYF
jgi:hypothetical protein